MKPGLQPISQTLLGMGQIDVGHANLRESELMGPSLKLGDQIRGLGGQAQQDFLVAIEPIVKNTCWRTETDTLDSALRLAGRAEIAHAIIELQGDLGAGKTTWVRHLLRALGVAGRIKSPSYGVVEPHLGQWQGRPLSIWHFDFYRLNDPREWLDAGLRDVFVQEGLKLVEWPERAGAQRPTADLALHIETDDQGLRRVRALASTPVGAPLLEAL
jgi:tRNA threonylcarbamoyladenosine biosynthesis protein TsaE